FCLWDTKLTDFNVMNSPYKKDIVGMLAEACHRRGINLEIYYSVVDWHHPAYPNIGRHHEILTDQANHNLDKYMDFLKGQIRELCSNYGVIHGIWWDMNVPQHKDLSVHEMIRKLQPSALINNRGFDDGDYSTPERDYDPEAANPDDRAFKRPTEACQSVGLESWGYRTNEDYYTDRHLLRSIDKFLARGANYLLNVGPTGEGLIPPESTAVLERIGKWYHAVSESLLDMESATHLTSNRDVLLTRRGNDVYVHLYRDPVTDTVKLKPLQTLPKRATLLNDGREVEFAVDLLPSEHVDFQPVLRLTKLPTNELSNTVLVVKLEFEEGLEDAVAAKTPEKVDVRVR
ncbi:MAG: alpha-L-fucosidase, partial [Armatimonadota bacterium]